MCGLHLGELKSTPGNCSRMSVNVIQLVQSGATSSHLKLTDFTLFLCVSHTHRHTLPKAHSNRIHISMSPHKFTYGWQIFQPYAGQNSQISSALLTNAASFPHMSSSVHHSEGTKPPPSIMYALIDLIETENVMFHSGALLIGWLSVTRLVRQLETIEPWVEMNLKGEVGTVGVSDCVCVCTGGPGQPGELERGEA